MGFGKNNYVENSLEEHGVSWCVPVSRRSIGNHILNDIVLVVLEGPWGLVTLQAYHIKVLLVRHADTSSLGVTVLKYPPQNFYWLRISRCSI